MRWKHFCTVDFCALYFWFISILRIDTGQYQMNDRNWEQIGFQVVWNLSHDICTRPGLEPIVPHPPVLVPVTVSVYKQLMLSKSSTPTLSLHLHCPPRRSHLCISPGSVPDSSHAHWLLHPANVSVDDVCKITQRYCRVHSLITY